MRMTAPAIGGAAILLAAALVWRFQPEPPALPEDSPAVEPEPASLAEADILVDTEPAIPAPAPDVRSTDVADASPGPGRAPLPGEALTTPMAQLVAEHQNLIRGGAAGAPGDEFPPDIVTGELQFAAEPVDSTWASAAEADVLATFAQMPGLKLIDLDVECRSTMCRVDLTQPNAGALDGRPLSFSILRDSLGLEPRWMMMVGGGDGAAPLRSVAYLWREGFASRQEPAEPQRNE